MTSSDSWAMHDERVFAILRRPPKFAVGVDMRHISDECRHERPLFTPAFTFRSKTRHWRTSVLSLYRTHRPRHSHSSLPVFVPRVLAAFDCLLTSASYLQRGCEVCALSTLILSQQTLAFTSCLSSKLLNCFQIRLILSHGSEEATTAHSVQRRSATVRIRVWKQDCTQFTTYSSTDASFNDDPPHQRAPVVAGGFRRNQSQYCFHTTAISCPQFPGSFSICTAEQHRTNCGRGCRSCACRKAQSRCLSSFAASSKPKCSSTTN